MTTTNGSATATVKTLTAEVRVLQVGNRQVTMSVYRQLDHVPFADIEPFGRVRDKTDSETWIHLVGKSRKDGALVRSWIKPPHWMQGGDDVHETFGHLLVHERMRSAGNLNGPIAFVVGEYGSHRLSWCLETERNEIMADGYCPRWRVTGYRSVPRPDMYIAGLDGRATRNPDYDVWSWLLAEALYHARQGDTCDLARLRTLSDAAIRDALAVTGQKQDDYDAAAALPLIVLAGLR